MPLETSGIAVFGVRPNLSAPEHLSGTPDCFFPHVSKTQAVSAAGLHAYTKKLLQDFSRASTSASRLATVNLVSFPTTFQTLNVLVT